MTDYQGVIQVIMPPAVQSAFGAWLASRGWRLYQIPGLDNDLPTYGIDPFGDCTPETGQHVSGHGEPPTDDHGRGTD